MRQFLKALIQYLVIRRKISRANFKGTLKATVKIDLDGDSNLMGAFQVGFLKIELPDYLKINHNFILVFDDLERCELKKVEVLGYINYFCPTGRN